MVSEGPAEMLHGRRVEREALDRLLEAVRGGQSGVLVVTGEPGVGKTALLESAVSSASGFRALRAVGVESDMELAFAALQQLCAPLLDRLERIPAPQREALEVAFGLRAGKAPDRFLVGLAVLSLFAEVAEEQPLLCVVDDAQWLDRVSAQALAFVARRLLAESVALVFATRDPGEELEGVPRLRVEGLPDADARALLSSAMRVPLDEQVRERILAETHGNPLALLELPRGLTPSQLAGGFGLQEGPGLAGRLEDSFQRRLAGLPADTQRLLLLAAAEPVGDPVVLWRAAVELGIGAQAAAYTDGLLTIGTGVTFRHPLVRSSVYRAASPEERQAMHRALANATDPELDPDRRAWHLAAGALGPDEQVAAELESSAGRAQARGGLAAAAAFLERATALTVESSRRARRALAAARAKYQAGALDPALALLATAESGPLNEVQRAQVDQLRGQIAFAARRGGDAAALLLEAAKRLEPLDSSRARETYAEAFAAAMYAARLAKGTPVLDVAKAVRAAKPAEASRDAQGAADLLLNGLALLITEGTKTGTPMVKHALRAVCGDGISNDQALRWLWLACAEAMYVWDAESWRVLSYRFLRLARDAGAVTVIPLALSFCAGWCVYAGEFASAQALGDEARSISAAISSPDVSISSLFLAGWRGREAEASQLIEASDREAAGRGEGRRIGAGRCAAAVLYNGLGHYELALAAAKQVTEYREEPAFFNWGLAELIEAAARGGKVELAGEALGRLIQTTTASGTGWALGVESRSRALLSAGETAEGLYQDAIDRLGRTRLRPELARGHLVYGEWLRREGRRLDAREELRSAHELFRRFGMEAFAERARVELEGTGGQVRKRTAETRGELTPQEAHISRLAADGATNQEIGAQLFISPSTVDYHLRKVFRKLGVKSRHHLKQQLLDPIAPATIDEGSGSSPD